MSGSVTVHRSADGPGCLIQALWFGFVGWWLGGLAAALGWILNLTVVGLPLGLAIFGAMPKLIALQSPTTLTTITTRDDGSTVVSTSGAPQHSLLVRAAFFLLVGWWWSGIWTALAYLVCGTLILMPIGLKMFRYMPTMTTLRRY